MADVKGTKLSDIVANDLLFYVNGKKVQVEAKDVLPEQTLLTFLRSNLGLTGTKLGCAEGGCGACTVMLSHYNIKEKKVDHRAVNACLMPVCAVAFMHVVTVEGIGNVKHKKIHPVQERMANSHGSQCGFCTPGFVMSMYTLLRNNPNPTEEEIEHTFDGNLCRCTGYRPIIDGFKTFAQEPQKSNTSGCPMGDKCCKMGGKGCIENPLQEDSILAHDLFDKSKFKPYDPSQELIFPSELTLLGQKSVVSQAYKSDTVAWFSPVTLDELLKLKQAYPQCKIVNGNTEIGIETKFKNCLYPVILAGTHVEELNVIMDQDDGVLIGAAVTLSRISKKFSALGQNSKTRTFTAAVEMLRWFAGNQIRNVAAVGGNIATASPISDLNPLWMAAEAYVVAKSNITGERKIFLRDFFLGYRKVDLKETEVIVSLFVPYTKELEFIDAFKQARRKDDDIAIVNSAMRVELIKTNDNYKVKSCSFCFGGMAAISISAIKTEKTLVGMDWNEKLLEVGCDALAKELAMSADCPGGMVRFRQSLVLSFLFKFYLSVSDQLGLKIAEKYKSAKEPMERGFTQSCQAYQQIIHEDMVNNSVHLPEKHLAATKQATGEAVYVDDIPQYHNEKYGCLVLSKRAHANIKSVKTEKALSAPGVLGFLGPEDIPGVNLWGPILKDEEVICSKKVTSVGQVVGMIVADNQVIAQAAAKLVDVEYEDLPCVLTIEQAIEKESYHVPPKSIVKGDVIEGFKASDTVIEGEVRMGGQEHFYLETNACIAVPKEGEMQIHCSTQAPTKTQLVAATALGIPQNRVTCHVKRLGGGFGGKETRTVILSTVLALAANKFGVPVRCMLDRDEDMLVTGQRHPFLAKYKAGVTKDGKLKALKAKLYCNAGYSADLSTSVLERSLFHIDGVYNMESMDVEGFVCKTNTVSNTAFRGFGGPQGLFICESIVYDIAMKANLSQNLIREANLYNTGELTHFTQELIYCQIRRIWDKIKVSSDYDNRLAGIKEYNDKNRFRKRGIHITPTKFGISFTAKFLNQAGALVNIYQDGSVLVSHGGTEMGQGLHTKMAQVVATQLQCPLENVYINETATDKVPNTSPTAASASADLNGAAIQNACEKLNERLKPYRLDPNGNALPLQEAVTKAYLDRVSLSATGFYATPNLSWDWVKKTGNPFAYFTYGACCSEVEIDTLSGDYYVLRSDIIMDVGKSLNPAIDIGQVEGAFVQGLGLFTMEETLFSPEGRLRTIGPGAYKIPALNDIPRVFNVALLEDCPNTRAIYSSKAVGEPPLHLASSVFFAIKSAVHEARKENNDTDVFRFDSPATSERIRMACTDQFTARIPDAILGEGKRAWNVVI